MAIFSLQYFKIHIFGLDPSGRVIYGVGLRPVSCWDWGLKSRRGHECLPVVIVVCCQVEVSAIG